MLIFVLSFVAGLLVGWHVPQPSWLKKPEVKVVSSGGTKNPPVKRRLPN